MDILIGIGRKAKDIVEGAKMYGIETLYFEEKEELYPELLKIVETGDLILTKAFVVHRVARFANLQIHRKESDTGISYPSL